MVHRTLLVGLFLGVLTGLYGCSDSNSIKDPWVAPGGDRYKEERSRSPQSAEQLRERLVRGQVDR